jgi:DivIVA domain-containing protein
VHELLTRIQKTFDGTADEHERVTPDIIHATELKRGFRGYDRHQVDTALLDCVGLLESQVTGRSPDQVPSRLPAEPLPRYEFDVVIRGYAPGPVHELLTRIQKTFDGTADEHERVTPDIIHATELKRGVRGYDRHQVDRALLDCVRRLGER